MYPFNKLQIPLKTQPCKAISNFLSSSMSTSITTTYVTALRTPNQRASDKLQPVVVRCCCHCRL